jgi:23S rRNA (uracil1939-C5)-methyltransferase
MNVLSTIDCPHFGPCSGCTLNQGVDSPSVWSDVKRFYKEKGASLEELRVDAIRFYRIKAKLAVRGTFSDPKIGLFKQGTHQVLQIPHCQVHHPSITHACESLKRAISKAKVPIYNEECPEKGGLRYVQCFVEIKTGKVQLVLVVKTADPNLSTMCAILWEEPLWHSIWLNVQPEATNVILGEQWDLLHGERWLQQPFLDRQLSFHPGAFAQAHWTLFQRLASEVVEWIPRGASLIEYYAGVGAMGLLAASKSKSVALVENNPWAYQSYQSMSSLSNVTYHCQQANERRDILTTSDCVLLDPPRKGIDPLLLEALREFSGRIVYVSCHFGSFVRDAESLIDAGWTLKEGRGYLMFPGTHHVETTALFEKG